MKDNRRSEVKLWRNRKKLRERKEQRRNSSEKNISKKARKTFERIRSSKEGRREDAWPHCTEEGRAKQRNATVSRKEAKTRRCPNGGTRQPEGCHPERERYPGN